MKTIKLFTMLALAGATLVSCEDYGDAKMCTIVNKDGTCTREINLKDDSPKSIALSDDWTRTPDATDTARATYSRTFANAEQMSQDMPLLLNGKPLQSTATFEKKFRWFYTEYTFTEEFASLGGDFQLPPTDFATADEVGYWFTGQPNLTNGMNGAEAAELLTNIGEKMDSWLSANLFYSGFDYICDNYDQVKNPPVSREEFASLRDSLIRFRDSLVAFARPDDSIANLARPATSEQSYYGIVFEKFFGSKAFDKFFNKKDETSCYSGLNEQVEPLMHFSALSVPYTLSMPGKVIDCGTGICQNGTVIYPLTGERMIPHSYTISATSRVKHTWAYIVMVLIVAMAVGCTIMQKRK